MLFAFLQTIASHMLFFALHLEAGSFPRPLTPRQEAEAFRALRAGDPQARDRIIRHNLRLVAHIAKKYYASFGDQDDLISIGTIGLIKAVNSFDSEKQARFSTYASRCIENELRMQFRKVRRTPVALSLQDPLDSQEGSLTVMDVVTDNFLLDENYEQKEEQAQLHRLVDTIKGRERNVLILRYGLSGQSALTQAEVAQVLGISRSYVSRIEKKAVENLRKSWDQSACPRRIRGTKKR